MICGTVEINANNTADRLAAAVAECRRLTRLLIGREPLTFAEASDLRGRLKAAEWEVWLLEQGQREGRVA